MRLLTFLATLAFLFASVRADAQTTNSLELSVQAYDQVLASARPDSPIAVGDMLFKKEHIQAWRDFLKAKLNGGKGQLQGAFDFTTSGSAWTSSTVYYKYQTTGTNAVPASTQLLFEQAIRQWQKVASLNFVLQTSEPNYILIKYTGTGAGAKMNSYIGMTGGSQELNVAGWGNLIDCAHELGHALGMTHEQCRPDRDTYVTLLTTNLADGEATGVNYAIVPTTIQRTSYDYDSLMHYPRNANAKSAGLITMLANSPNERWSDGKFPDEIGQKDHLSAGDKAAMAVQYGSPLVISGHVQDAAGNPLNGVTVTLQTSGAIYRGSNPITTDLNGNYTFDGIPRNTGNYTIIPSQLGASFTIGSQTVSMTTASQTTVNFVQTDSAPPGLVITNPAPSGIYSTLTTAGGTASDNAGVKEVRVALARTSDLVWWNWVAGTWGTTTFDWATNVKLATGTTEWSVNLPTFADGGYQLHVQSVDNADNASPWLMRHFFMDPTPPTVVIENPVNNANLDEFTNLRGTASDGNGTGIADNKVYFTLYNDGDFWTGFDWKSGTTAQDPDVLLKADVVAGEWSYNQLPTDGDARIGQYAVSAFVRDGATNTSQPNPGVTSILFTVDRSPPTGSVQSPVNNATIDYLPSGTWFSGIASDDHAVSYVNLFIRRESDGLFWNGSGWSELSTPESIITSTLAGNSWHNTSALPIPGVSLANGAYAFIAVIVDTAGNQQQVESDVTIAYHPTYTWTAGSFSDGDPDNNNNNWNNPANWDPYGVPSDDSKVIINGGTPYAGHLGTINLFELDFTAGTVTFTALSIQDGGEFNWSGGSLQSSLCSIPATGTMTIFGNATKDFPYGAITNAGTITWTDGGPIVGGNAAHIDNGGVFEITGDSYFYYSNAGGRTVFNNYPTGTVRKKDSSGISYFHGDYGGWQFNNSGTIDVQNGIISLNQGSKNLNNGGSITGAGNARLRSTGDTLTVNGTTTLGSSGRLELASGTMVGTGTFAGSGTFEWTGGAIAGGGTLTIGPSANLLLSPGTDRSIYGGTTFVNSGTGVATLGNTWFFSSSGAFVNSGLFTFQSDFTIYYDNGGASPAIINTGTLRKSGTDGAVTIHTDYGGTRFHNSGTVDIQQGTFKLGGGGTGGGTWQTTATGLTEFTGNTMTLTNGTIFTGAGTNRVNGGRVNFDANSPGNVSVSGIFELLSGAWGGSGSFTSNGRLGWNAGTIDGYVSIGSALKMQIASTAEKYLGSGVITNAGSITWSGTGQLTAGAGAHIDNGGTFEAVDDAFFFYNNAGAGVAFNNYPTGLLRKKNSSGITYFRGDYGGWQFNNSGTVDVQSGILSLDQGSKNLNDGGSITGAARLRSTGGTLSVNGTTTIGSGGRLELRSGTMVGTGSLNGSGTFEWTGGAIAGGGTLTIGPSANLLLSPGDDRALYGGTTFINSGTGVATLGNTWIFSSSGTFVNSGLLTFQSDFTIFYDNGGAAPAFVNTGTLRKSGTDGAVSIHTFYGGTRFHNSGTVDIQQGTFQLGGGGVGGGTWQTTATGLTEFTGNTMTLTNGTAFTGSGTNRINGGRVNFDTSSPGNVSVSGIFELLSGAWGGSGSFTSNGRLGWNAGTIDGYVSIGSALKMQIASTEEKYLGSGVITNAGSITWSGTGQLTAGAGAHIDNGGIFEAVDDAFFLYNNAGAGVAFNNYPTGVFRKKNSSGITYFRGDYGGWQFNNSGTVDVQSGILSLDQGSKNLNDGGSITGTARLRSTSGTIGINGTTTIGSGGRLELASGTMVGTGTFAGSGTFEWTGGGIAGGGTLNIGPTANFLLSQGDDRALYGGTTLNNYGTALATLANTLVFSSSAVFNNNGLFILQSDFNFFYDNGGSRPSFNNNVGATIRRNTSAGEVRFRGDYGGILFQNSGVIDLQSGLLRLDSPATINPTSNIRIALKGMAPGTEAPQLNFGGGITFNGALSIVLTNSYTPTLGDTYVLMNHGGSTGTFSTPALPALTDNKAWKVNYTGTQVVLEVVQAYALDNPVKQGDGSYSISFTGAAAASIEFQVSDNLADWVTLQTVNDFTGTQNFIDADAHLYARRFYRVLITP